MNYITLNNGIKMPQIGFGVYQIPITETAEAVYQAIKSGYRLIDTAISYGNEVETGLGIQRALVEGITTRDQLFITTKLFIEDADEERAKQAINRSLKQLGLAYLDLYLIHQPYGDVYGAWRALWQAQEAGKVRSIGVSNFDSAKLIEFIKMNDVAHPQVNQIEVNPWYQRQIDVVYHESYQVQIEAWAPFAEGRYDLFTQPKLLKIGQRYGKSVAQVVLRWLIQRGIVVLAKSVKPERMVENLTVFDFKLTQDEMHQISQLDRQTSAFFNHHDPTIVEWFMNRL